MLSATDILIAAVGVFIIGVIFLQRGIWPRRVGDTPYCGRCKYNLTGIESDRCPECGGDVTPATIVYGLRRRRPGLIAAGAACMLPLLLVAGVWLTNIDWYRYKPTGWVISDLNTTNVGKWQKVWTELDRRIRLGAVSPEHESRLTDICLIEQGKKSPSSGRLKDSVDYLGDAYLRGVMSDAQAEKYFHQIIHEELRVREKIIVGANVPYLANAHSRSPSLPWSVKVYFGAPWFDDQRERIVMGGDEGSVEISGVGASGYANGSLSHSLEPGPHTLKVPLSLIVHTESPDGAAAGTVHHEREITLEAAFEVLASEPSDYVTIVHDPNLHDQLLDCFAPRNFRVNYSPALGVRGEIAATVMPISVAFDVIARVQDDEFKIGELVSEKGEKPPMWRLHYFWRYDNPPIESFDLILRSNEGLVRNSVDMYEAWEGELVYEDVPVSSNSAP